MSLLIEEIATGKFVGSVRFNEVFPRFSCFYGIRLLKDFWGLGYALKSQELMLRFLFHELGLSVVRLYTTSNNVGAVKRFEKSGFKISGKHREAVFNNSVLADNLVMDLLSEEFYENHPELKGRLPNI